MFLCKGCGVSVEGVCVCNGVVLVLVLVERVCVWACRVCVCLRWCVQCGVGVHGVCLCVCCRLSHQDSVVWHTTTDRQTHRHTLHEPKPHCTWFLFTSIRV